MTGHWQPACKLRKVMMWWGGVRSVQAGWVPLPVGMKKLSPVLFFFLPKKIPTPSSLLVRSWDVRGAGATGRSWPSLSVPVHNHHSLPTSKVLVQTKSGINQETGLPSFKRQPAVVPVPVDGVDCS